MANDIVTQDQDNLPVLAPESSAVGHWTGKQLAPDSTRRQFIAGGAKFFAGAAVVGAGGTALWKYTTPQKYKLALLKMDTKTDQLALVHRTLSLSDQSAMAGALVETGKNTVDGLDPLTVTSDGSESIIISPELTFRPKENDAEEHNVDGQDLPIQHAPKNIYLPYHLLDHAADFTIRNVGNRICLTITSLPEAKTLTTAEQAAINAEYARQVVVHQAEVAEYNLALAAYNANKGWAEGVDRGLDYLGNPGGYGKGDPDVGKPPTPPGPAPEYPKPNMVQAKFSMTLDAPDIKSIPDIHFYNGKTNETPSEHLTREEIARALLDSPDQTVHVLRSMPKLDAQKKPQHDENGNPLYNRHFINDDIAHGVDAAERCRDCAPQAGFGLQLIDGATKMVYKDNQLSTPELQSMQMATVYQQGMLDARSEKSWIGAIDETAVKLGATDSSIGR